MTTIPNATGKEPPKGKSTGLRRRGPGIDKQHRVSFIQRIEADTYDRLEKLLEGSVIPRNKYIEDAILLSLNYHELFKASFLKDTEDQQK
jgi:hypothetical protein